MPNIQSAKKALRQSKTRRARNLRRINAYKNTFKQYTKLVKAGKTDEAKTLLAKVYQALDKASKAGVIKPNKAARLKSHAILAIAKRA